MAGSVTDVDEKGTSAWWTYRGGKHILRGMSKEQLYRFGRRFLPCLDLAFFVVFLGCCLKYAAFFEVPPVQNTQLFFLIPMLFLAAMALGMGFLFLATAPFSRFRSLLDKPPQKITFQVTSALVFLASAALFVSWFFAFQRYHALFDASPTFGLRAITTNLHALVPLESRLLFTVIPTLLLFPFSSKKGGMQKALFALLVVIAILTQTKLGFLFTAAFGTLYLFSARSFLRDNRFRVACAAGLFLLGGFGDLAIDMRISSTSKVTQSALLPSLPAPPVAVAPLPGTLAHRCSGYSPKDLEKIPGAILGTTFANDGVIEAGLFAPVAQAVHNIAFRSYAMPAKVVRLFLCLREEGWRPGFRGHQLFRVVGGYIPYYRMAYREFRFDLGSSVSSAVTNAPVDAYFNAGFAGVLIAGFIAGVIWKALFLMGNAAHYFHVSLFVKAYFVLILCQGSILSAVVTVVPIALLLCFDATVRTLSKGWGQGRSLVPSPI